MFTPTQRRPYITNESELKIYNKAKKMVDDIRTDKKLNYCENKEITRRMISSHIKSGFSLEDECIFICNEALGAIASEGVYYLMEFILLGIITKEHNQKINFVEMELQYINELQLLKDLKNRINEKSYSEMEKDLKDALSFYEIEENDIPMEHPTQLLSDKDIKKFYEDLRVYAFYYQTIKDMEDAYEAFLKAAQETMGYEDAIKCAISQTISFTYYEDQPFIDVCEPARIYTVMAIARFLIEKTRSKSFLDIKMKEDLESIIKNSKVKQYKEHFSKADYTDLTEDEKIIAKWFEE